VKRRTVVAAAVLAVAIPAASWLNGGEAPISREVSPDGAERLELVRPSRWRQLTGYDDGDYAVARLIRTSDGTTLGISAPFFLDGAGATRWTGRAVEVGVAARFNRATGAWTVQP